MANWDGVPAHISREAYMELLAERDRLAEALRVIGSDYCTHAHCDSREHRKARAALAPEPREDT